MIPQLRTPAIFYMRMYHYHCDADFFKDYYKYINLGQGITRDVTFRHHLDMSLKKWREFSELVNAYHSDVYSFDENVFTEIKEKIKKDTEFVGFQIFIFLTVFLGICLFISYMANGFKVTGM